MSAEVRETTFAWPARRKSSWILAGLIFAMLFLHSLAFFLFQAATPAIQPPPRTAPPVQLLTLTGPDGLMSPENESLLRWVEAEDPSLVARIPNVDPPPLVEIPYRPSYMEMRTAPLDLPAEPATVQFPPARDAMSIILSGVPQVQREKEEILAQPTRIAFSSNLARRAPASIAFRPQTRSDEPLQPGHFFIGVTAEGEVRFVFPQKRETGSLPALDGEAERFLATLEFAPIEGAPITWGHATIEWGDEIAAER